MKIARSNQELKAELLNYKLNNPDNSIGFVPTMGALHDGHISLVNQGKENCDYIVVSIFVNPTQFNESADLTNYPRTESADIELLKLNGCDLVFIPTVEDIYPKNRDKYSIDLMGLDKVMEGKFRDNHFDGVCMVVERLFNLVEPDFAYFGKKDFQQVAVVDFMVKERGLKVEIVACPIKRESSGLAMSSRNELLTNFERNEAKVINEALSSGLAAYQRGFKLNRVKETILSVFYRGNLELEYLEIVDNKTLKRVTELNGSCTVCIAAYCGSVRLIDNFQFFK